MVNVFVFVVFFFCLSSRRHSLLLGWHLFIDCVCVCVLCVTSNCSFSADFHILFHHFIFACVCREYNRKFQKKMAARTSNDGLLARVNFPLYSVEMLTSRHVLVAGGGGSSKTGVANGFVRNSRLFIYFSIALQTKVCDDSNLNIPTNLRIESIGNL